MENNYDELLDSLKEVYNEFYKNNQISQRGDSFDGEDAYSRQLLTLDSISSSEDPFLEQIDLLENSFNKEDQLDAIKHAKKLIISKRRLDTLLRDEMVGKLEKIEGMVKESD